MSAPGPVVVEVVGGLGNQLFQYAVGRALAARTGAELVLDLRLYKVYHVRSFELDRLKTVGRLATESDYAFFGRTAYSNNRGLRKIQRTLDPWLARRGVVYDERLGDFVYDQAVTGLKPPVLLRGFWQTPKYFESIRSELLSELQPREPLSSRTQTFLGQIRANPMPVSINARRGDYVTNPRNAREFGSCTLRYYGDAITRMKQHHPHAHFFVFSDDINWCRANIRVEDAPVTYVDSDGSDKSLADLMLMKACRHHIVANSSFSWWGAWLADEKDHEVIAPKHWMALPDVNDSDLIPATWTRLLN